MASGTASTIETKQFAELVAAVVRQLPRDIDPSAAQRWIEDQGSLQSALRGALMPTNGAATSAPVPAATLAPTVTSHPVCVNHALSLKDMIKRGKYDWKNEDITSKNFPHDTAQGTKELNVELVHFGRYIESDEVISEMEKLGLRPATLPELLAFGEKYPDIQREYPVIALGSMWTRPGGGRHVPVLYRDDGERDLGLCWWVGGWSDRCRFVAVCK